MIIGTRQPEQTSQKIMKSIGTTSIPEFKTMFVDLASLKSVREFVKSLGNRFKLYLYVLITKKKVFAKIRTSCKENK